MKKIFARDGFPAAPGGDRYEWSAAKTVFTVPGDGGYVIAVTASCRNGVQNGTGDDDDLRMSLDGYEFGRAESHVRKISYRGFGVGAAWDGASLKSAVKTVYFFVELDRELDKLFSIDEKKEHVVRFYADGRPRLVCFEVFQLNEDEGFVLENVEPVDNQGADRSGIPWLSFVFFGKWPEKFVVTANCGSAKQKGGYDGDNIKVVINGKILSNATAVSSKKYKNFYFSGDQMQAADKTLTLEYFHLHKFESNVELWYDQTPTIKKIDIVFYADPKYFFEKLMTHDDYMAREHAYIYWNAAAACLEAAALRYAAEFLFHSMEESPKPIIFDYDSPIVKKIRQQKMAYGKIVGMIVDGLKEGNFSGAIVLGKTPEQEINFDEDKDLSLSVHGVKELRYESVSREDGGYDVYVELMDVYDFDPQKYTGVKSFIVNLADKSEKLGVIKNFPITIKIKERIYL